MASRVRRAGRLGLVVATLCALVSSATAQLLPDLSKPGSKAKAAAENEHVAPVEPGQEVKASAKVSATSVAPGGQIVVAVIMDHAPGWHTWPSLAQDVLPKDVAEFAIRTEVKFDSFPAWIDRIGPVRWPDPIEGRVANPMGGDPLKLQLYQRRAIVFVPITIKADAAPGPATLKVLLSYQACNDTMCVMPEDKALDVSFQIAPGGAAKYASSEEDFAAFRADAFAGASKWPAPKDSEVAVKEPGNGDQTPPTQPAPTTSPSAPTDPTFFGISLGFLKGPLGLVLLLLLSGVGGAILNLTPCVLPVIPIKVMTLNRHAGAPAKALYLGFWMALGVVAFWFAISLPVVLLNGFTDPSKIFGYWYVTLAIGVLIALMSLGLMGLFTLTLPQQVYMINPNAENAPGSFLFGAMTAVLGLPCFGFAAGPLLLAAAKWNSPVLTVGVFTAIGVGMAAPYFILSARPSLLKAVPKTGPASELVKQVMGLLLLAAGVYFMGSGLIALVIEKPWIAKELHWWGAAIFACMAGLWLTLRTAQISRKPIPTFFAAIVGIAIGGAAVLYARHTTDLARSAYDAGAASRRDDTTIIPHTWTPYSPARFEAAKARHMVVVLDFTAEWCLTCRAIKAAVLDREPVNTLLRADDVALLEVDLTSNSAPGWKLLHSLGQTGIPMLAIYGPGLPADQPWKSNAYSSDQVVGALEQARGAGPASKP